MMLKSVFHNSDEILYGRFGILLDVNQPDWVFACSDGPHMNGRAAGDECSKHSESDDSRFYAFILSICVPGADRSRRRRAILQSQRDCEERATHQPTVGQDSVEPILPPRASSHRGRGRMFTPFAPLRSKVGSSVSRPTGSGSARSSERNRKPSWVVAGQAREFLTMLHDKTS